MVVLLNDVDGKQRGEYEGTKETDGERQGLIETGTEEKGLLLVAGVS
jgi:hypothetical protein